MVPNTAASAVPIIDGGDWTHVIASKKEDREEGMEDPILTVETEAEEGTITVEASKGTPTFRRYLKAKRPPNASDLAWNGENNGMLHHDDDGGGRGDEDNTPNRASSNLKSPSQMREEEEEWCDRQRLHRLEASAKLQKEHKETFIRSRREADTEIRTEPIERLPPNLELTAGLPKSLTVEPAFPEHKRREGGDAAVASFSGGGGGNGKNDEGGDDNNGSGGAADRGTKRYKMATFEDEVVEGATDANDDDDDDDEDDRSNIKNSKDPLARAIANIDDDDDEDWAEKPLRVDDYDSSFWFSWRGAAVVAVLGVLIYAALSTMPSKRR